MVRLKSIRMLKGLIACGAACLAIAGQAAPGDTSSSEGTATALVVQPPQITAVDALRFGVIMSPAASGTVTVVPDGTFSTTLDLTGTPSTRAPARFLVFGERNRRFVTAVSPSMVVLNENNTPMVVSNMTYNRPSGNGQGQGQHNRTNQNGLFNLYVGGTLNVQAGQEAGLYSGEFDVTVVYL